MFHIEGIVFSEVFKRGPPLPFLLSCSKDCDFSGRRGGWRFLVLATTMIEIPVSLFSVQLTFESLYQSKMLLIKSNNKKQKTKKIQPLNTGDYFSYITSNAYVGV